MNLSAVQFRNGVWWNRSGAHWRPPIDSRSRSPTLSPSAILPPCARPSMKSRALAVKVALDDFGTATRASRTLAKFRFDKVKIDRSFVIRLGRNPMAASLIHLMSGLGKTMVVEGGESPEQCPCCAASAQTSCRDFFFSNAEASSEIAALLSREPSRFASSPDTHVTSTSGRGAFTKRFADDGEARKMGSMLLPHTSNLNVANS